MDKILYSLYCIVYTVFSSRWNFFFVRFLLRGLGTWNDTWSWISTTEIHAGTGAYWDDGVNGLRGIGGLWVLFLYGLVFVLIFERLRASEFFDSELFLDKSSLVTPRLEWIGCFIKAATLFVDALMSIHDEGTGAIGTGLSGQRAGTLLFVKHISSGSIVLFPFSSSEAWPFGIVGADLDQGINRHLVEKVVVVSNTIFVVLEFGSFEAVRTGEIHRSKNTHGAGSISGGLREATAGLETLIFSSHSVEEFSKLGGVVEALFTLSNVSEFALASHRTIFLAEELLSTASSVAVGFSFVSGLIVVTAKRVEEAFSA